MVPKYVLQVEDVRVQYDIRRSMLAKAATLVAVDGLSIAIPRGETLGLVGESGCGKTTLVRAILGLERVSSGRILLDGEDITRMGARQVRQRRPKMQVVFQDPYSSLDPRMTIHDIIAEPLRIYHRYRSGRVEELLHSVGLQAEVMKRRASALSGGQQQRIAIARALALEPDLVILDEPVSALDVSIRSQVVNVLTALQVEQQLSYLFIAHDLSIVHHMAQRIAVMYLGKIVETGTREQVFDHPQHPYTKLLISSAPLPTPDGRNERRRSVREGELPNPLTPPSGCPFRMRCPVAVEQCANEVPLLVDSSGSGHETACWMVP